MASNDPKESLGRELAVEALMDMHKSGPACRVAKIMEEGPAAALSARPVKITRSMLVDKARSLSRYENSGEYLDFPASHDKNEEYSTPKEGFEETTDKEASQRERILRHHAKITKIKTTEFRARVGITAAPDDIASPPPQLISSLRKIYGTSSTDGSLEELEDTDLASSVLPDLLQHVFGNRVFGKIVEPARSGEIKVATSDCEENSAQPTTSPISNIETIIGNAFSMEQDSDNFLPGLITAALCVLTTSIKTSANYESSLNSCELLNLHDGQFFRGLQVSGPLSLILNKIEPDNILGTCGGEDYLPGKELMDYFRNSADIYEKRIEIQKARILAEVRQSNAKVQRNPCDAGSNSDSDESIPPVLLHRGDDESSNDSIASSDNYDSKESEDNPLSDSDQDSSSDSSGDEDIVDEEENCSSSGSDIGRDDDDDQEIIDDGAEDEAHLLEEALALSLAELNTAIAVVANESRIQSAEVCPDSEDEEEKVVGVLPTSTRKFYDDDNGPCDLPSIPNLPDGQWLSSTWGRGGLDVGTSSTTIIDCCDPAALATFGKLPASNIFIIILSLVVEVSEKKRRMRISRTATDASKHSSTPKYSKKDELEAMLRDLSFGDKNENPVINKEDMSYLSHGLHLTIATLDLLATTRIELFDALCDELLAADEIGSSSDDDESQDNYNTDDPANVAVGTGAQDTLNCLEEKGMVRKAAAAAHIAAIRKQRTEKKINELVELIKLMSLGSFLTLRHLRLIFMELSTRCPLEMQHSTLSCEARLRLTKCLSTFTSTSVVAKFHERVQKMYMSSNVGSMGFNAMSFKLLLIEASSLWGESITCLMPNQTLLEQSLVRVLDIATSSGAVNLRLFGGHNTEVEDTQFAWSEKDEHILKLKAACRRIACTDALDYLIPRPIVQDISHADNSFHVPSAFISALGEAVFTGTGLTESVVESVEECYKCICHRIHIQFFQWGGGIRNSEDVFIQPEPKGESLGITKLLTARDPDLVFDSAKCADSIAIEAPINTDLRSPSVNQRANKVWGTVLSSKCFHPKTGVRRWAVKMEKCERGHIFIGVGTSRASTKTYVGGDKYGWGMIGTQALWHDRKKIRNDYGKTFRTGDTIVLTLDTNAGTLGFSLWTEGEEDGNSSQSSDMDFDLLDEKGDSKRGKLEDWGVAFEGLPLDTRLFPAVGMYQRDDKAILVGLQGTGTGTDSESCAFDSGCCFYPLSSAKTANIREWNEGICNEGIFHATNIIKKAIDILSDDSTTNRNIMFSDILPSFTASISTLPASIPLLSGKIAYNLLPIVLNCLAVVDQKIEDKFKCSPPISSPRSGKWNIKLKYLSRSRAGSKGGSVPSEEHYSVDLDILQGSNNTGHEINGSVSTDETATIHGTCRGNLIHFVEERSNGSDAKSIICLVKARLSLCGTKFQGTCDNSKYGSSVMIMAEYDDCGSEGVACEKYTQEHLVQCSYTLSIAVGHLSYILSEGATIHDMQRHTSNEIYMSKKMKCDLMNLITSSPILANGLRDDNEASLGSLQQLYQISDERFTTATWHTVVSWYDEVQNLLMMSKDENNVILTPSSIASLDFERIDAMMTLKAGGVGSLSSLDSSYGDARKSIVNVLLYHTGCMENLVTIEDVNIKKLALLWRTALNLVESGVRSAIMKPGLAFGHAAVCKKYCGHLQCVSSFLLRFEPSGSQLRVDSCIDQVKVLYLFLSADEELSNLQRFMSTTSKHALLKGIGLTVVQQILNRKDWTSAGAEATLTSFHGLVNNSYFSVDTSSKFTYPGANAIVQTFLSSMQMKAYSAIGALIKNPMLSDAFESSICPTVQSLLLATLACFIQSVHGFIHILKEEALWDFVEYVISHCLVDLKAGGLSTDETSLPQTSASAIILNRSLKVANFDILQTIVRMLHTVLFQLQKLGEESLLTRPFALLKSEILYIVQFVVEQTRSRADAENINSIKSDVERWNVTKSSALIPELDIIREHDEQRQTKILEFPLNWHTHIATVEDYMGQLFTCLCTITRSSTSPEQRHDIQFFKRLLKLFLDREFEIMAESHRHRVRYLRLLRIVLQEYEADEEILSSLFSHLGNALSDSIQGDIGFIEAKETISLIRYLYSIPDWRQGITKVSTSLLEGDKTMQTSVFSVFGGVPGRIIPGSFVLFSSTGSNSLYSASPGKVTSGQNECLPAGGIEGIVAGLSRKDSKAGVISSVDDFTSTCEVVLLNRMDYLRDNNKSGTTSMFSVRVERVPVSDITSVDENGLLLDKTFSLETHRSFPMKGALSSAILALKEESIDDSHSLGKERGMKYSDLALLLRSNIPFLSTPDLLHEIINDDESKECMAHLLELAALSSVRGNYGAANSACVQNLKCLSDFEARYWHLKGLLSSIKMKQNAMKDKIEKVIASLDEKYSKIVSQELRDTEDEHRASHPGEPIGSDDNSRGSNGRTSEEVSLGHTEGGAGSNNSGSDEENGSEDDQEEDSSSDNRQRSSEGNDELSHLREVAILQMLELGLPRSWSEYALRRVGGTNIEAAVHFCLERGADMERLIAEERVQERPASSSNRRRNVPGVSQLLQQLVEMGFPSHWCAEALAATGQNVDEALTWILTNGERLSALDENRNVESDSNSEEDEGDIGDDDTDVQKHSEIDDQSKDSNRKCSWPESVICPVRPISGRANIDGRTLELGGLPSGGFSSVGTKGVLLKTGKWYYECVLVTAGCIQLGWADSSFSGQADKGDGCGDGQSSWAYDGWRRYRWHCNATEWGCRWQEGDVVGCLVDMDCKEIRFTLNGKGEEVGMGLAFSGDGFKPCTGVYPCVSFNRKEKVRLLLGGTGSDGFVYPPPPGYKPVGEAIFFSVKELDCLLEKEGIITDKEQPGTKPYLCDFSDSEHGHEIFAWQHRYYGSDASVHLGVNRRPNCIESSRGGKSLIYQKRGDGDSTIDLMLTDIWVGRQIKGNDDLPLRQRLDLVLNEIQKSYADVFDHLYEEYQDVCLALCILYAKKSVVHIVSSMSSKFDFSWFCSKGDDEVFVARNFLSVVELCCALHYEGWVGEAGTMSLASEALGLAISSNERPLRESSLSSVLGGGKHSGRETKDARCYHACGYIQMLNSVTSCNYPTNAKHDYIDPSKSLAACAEISFSGKGIGAVTFLKEGLLSAVMSNEAVINVMIAFVRCSVRVLAGVQIYDDEKKMNDRTEADSDSSASNNVVRCDEREPDAKIVSFLTGLLMSGPIAQSPSGKESGQSIVTALFEAWNVGLLSRSVPWRMVSATTISSLLNTCPQSWNIKLSPLPTLKNFFERLESTTSRRMWAERAALPVCSRYLQSLIELQSSANRFPTIRTDISKSLVVDASTPQPLQLDYNRCDSVYHWESTECWVCSDNAWEVWTGEVKYFAVEWNAPGRSAVRSLMDGGKGPPMLREGCTVLRGLDWGEDKSGSTTGQEDGKEIHEQEKEQREESKKHLEEPSTSITPEINEDCDEEPQSNKESEEPSASITSVINEDCDAEQKTSVKAYVDPDTLKKKKVKLPHPKLPAGRVLSIEPWNGIPGKARRVRWDLTGIEGVYRYGGDGGKFDIVHVEVNDKCTRVIKRHPHDETAEQCAIRHGFGAARKYNIMLRLRKSEMKCEVLDGDKEHICKGILEWPDFGAGIAVTCRFQNDGTITLTENSILFGSKDSGWEARFGQPSFVPGTVVTLSTTSVCANPSIKEHNVPDESSTVHSDFEELLGSTSHSVKLLRNRANGKKLRVASEMRLVRSKLFSPDKGKDVSSALPPLSFDEDWHAPCMSLSVDKRTVTCTSAEGRNCAFLTSGFTKGIHYWEVKIDQAEVGSVYIGVAEKPKSNASSNGKSFEDRPRLNRWHGWGFVNFRATYNEGSERVYGSHCHAGDVVGVLLDCDSGRLSFFYDGVKYGEHILNDLGCAFENVGPFGFNADGCGGGGAGQGAPSGEGGRGGRYPANGNVRPKSLWPVIGLCHPGDCVTITRKWMTNYGIDGHTMVRNAMLVDEVLQKYSDAKDCKLSHSSRTMEVAIPQWLLKESFVELKRWELGRWRRTKTRADGYISLPTAGLNIDIDTLPISCAVACARLGLMFVLLPGARLSIKTNAGRHLEMPEEAEVLGSFQGRIWYKLISQKSEGGSLTEGGGRAWFWDESDVIEGAFTLIDPTNSANLIHLPLLDRFKCTGKSGLRLEPSSGGIVRSNVEIGGHDKSYVCPYECSTVWMAEYSELVASGTKSKRNLSWISHDFEEFQNALSAGQLSDMTPLESDSFLAQLLSSIADSTAEGCALDCSYDIFCHSLFNALKAHGRLNEIDTNADCYISDSSFHEAPALMIALLSSRFPPMKAVIARVAMLRALNRRSKYAIPLYSMRPSQENSAILGGYAGLGASVECLGKSRYTDSSKNWVRASSIGGRVRQCRRMIFTSVKTDILKSLVEATTTPTSLSHDEYELPRDIRTVRVNRVKAKKAVGEGDQIVKKEYTVFGQMQSELRGWSGNALRRGYVARGHGGQPRAFKVKLIGEGVNDYSGPYREVFTDALREVNKTHAVTMNLGLLDASPNKEFGVGENRNVNVFACSSTDSSIIKSLGICDEEKALREHYSSHLVVKSEKMKDLEESLTFLGKLVATAVRHGIPVDLDLPLSLVWKRLCEEDVSIVDSLKEVDLLASRRLRESTKDNGKEDLSVTTFLMKQQQMFNYFAEGVSSVLPVEVFSLFTGTELKDYFCGNDEVDVELLQKVVEYEGYNSGDAVIAFFWETLREMTTDERKLFLQFVWARSRMPLKEKDFDSPFKIQKDSKFSSNEALPTASTCFFTLSLPEYDSKEKLKDKLMFAIKNVKTMESDYVTNDAEVGEGWRGL